MKRVLIVTYYWPPSGGSGVQRWVKFAKYLPSEGWQPVIYTPENPDLTAVDKTLGTEIPPEAEVIRRPINEPYKYYRRLVGRKDDTEKTVTPISSGKKTLMQKISLFVRGNCFVPDPRVWWVRPSVRFLKNYLKEHPVDAIITTGPPQSMHLIGEKLHKATGIPWIPDFRDPWTRMYYLKHLPLTGPVWKKHLRMEQGVLDNATRVLTVTPLVQEDYAKRTATPVEMITNGYDDVDFGGGAGPDGFFNITHTGLFAADGNPFGLWKVLGEKAAADPEFASRLRLRLVGKVDTEVLAAIDGAGLSGNVVRLGYLDHPGAVREQKAATILILPLRNDPDYAIILPGKLFEYLASRRPILGIGQEDGAMARVVADCRAGGVFDWDNLQGIKDFVDKSWTAFLSGGVPAVDGNIEQYSRRNLTRQLASLLNDIVKR